MLRRFRMINENLSSSDYRWSNRRIGDTGTYAPKYQSDYDIVGIVQIEGRKYSAMIRDKATRGILAEDDGFSTASQAENWVENWFKRNLFKGSTSRVGFRLSPKMRPLEMDEYGELPSGNPGIIADNRYCTLTLSGDPIICELTNKENRRKYYIQYTASQERSAMRDFREYTRALSASLNVDAFIDAYGFKPVRRR